jgi:hypothetical protein
LGGITTDFSSNDSENVHTYLRRFILHTATSPKFKASETTRMRNIPHDTISPGCANNRQLALWNN